MARKRIFFHIFPYYLLVIFLTLWASAWYATSLLKDFYFRHVQEEIETKAKIIEQDLLDRIKAGNPAELQRFCEDFSGLSKCRITVIASDGKVMADSFEEPGKMRSHSDREEIIEALKDRVGRSIRYSSTLHKNMMYVAMRMPDAGAEKPVLRIAVPVDMIDDALAGAYLHITLAGIVIAIIAIILSILVSRHISRPILELEKGAANFAKGDFSGKLVVTDIGEIGDLAGSMNYMADELNRRMREIVEQRNRQNAILTSMMEGVVAVDAEGRIISLNRSASALFNAPDGAEGRYFHEVVRNAALQKFIDAVLSEKSTVERELSFFDTEQRHLYVRGTVLNDPEGGCIGALLVINDITRLKKLENLRSEFVANVSHEIKTPLTAINASVETLLDGNTDKAETEQLLKIIGRHTKRLTSIVDDILSLSKLEDGKHKEPEKFVETQITAVIAGAVDDCRQKAEEKQIILKTDCDKGLMCIMNSSLIEQALVNLIDNAIKYSESGSTVEICARCGSGGMMISVKDSGCGIPDEHLPRVFERFYRVDKARSGKLGGTGLGLSIVKHIANVHGGNVEVESTVGKGSKFTIVLPVSTKG